MKIFQLVLLCALAGCAARTAETSSGAQAGGKATMNSSDSEAKEKRQIVPPRRYLPDIVALEVERVPFKPPEYRFLKSVYADYTEALAFKIEVEGEIRLDQATTPVLYVGETALSHLEELGPGRYRFLAFPPEEEKLEPGAPIALGWPGSPARRRETKFRYEPPKTAR